MMNDSHYTFRRWYCSHSIETSVVALIYMEIKK
jgi:hypothetical protein